MTAQILNFRQRAVPVGPDAPVVSFDRRGTPLAVRWYANVWHVVGDPVQWSSASGLGEPGDLAADGQEAETATRFWRFKAQLNPESHVLEFDISTGPQCEDWQFLRVACE